MRTSQHDINHHDMALCSCPPGSAIGDIALPTCLEDFGQIQKMFFQRVYSTGTTKNKLTIASANPNVIASWSPLLSASDGTKVVQTPFTEGVTNTPGEPRLVGGGNDSLGGKQAVKGANLDLFEGNFYELPQSIAKQIRAYECEIFGVYLINEYGQIGGLADDNSNPTEFFPIPVAEKTFFLGQKRFGGFDERDANAFRFEVLPNVLDEFYVVTPTDFNPLDKLATS